MSSTPDVQKKIEAFRADFEALRAEVAKIIVGQQDVVEGVLTAMTLGGHVLVEGLPGTGKTELARALAEVIDLTFSRIPCTADLMPTDVIGTYVIMETPQGRRTFEFQKGPLFANLVLVDQINRTTPKCQSAFLDAMEQVDITVSTESFPLPVPFFLLATQNPLDMEGTFPLPEAQLDRFLFKLTAQPPSVEQLEEILRRTTEPEGPIIRTVLQGERLLEMGEAIREVTIADDVRRTAITLVTATQPDGPRAPESVRQYVRYGAGVRGAQALVLGAKAKAILAGRAEVSADDLRAATPAALGHRVILNFEGQAEQVAPESIVRDVLQAVTGGGSGDA